MIISNGTGRVKIGKINVAVMLIFLSAIAGYIFYIPELDKVTFGNIQVSTFSKDFTNVYIVSSGDKHIMIDAGLGDHQSDIESFIQRQGLSVNSISALILTHAHHDHAGTAAYFQQQGVKVIAGLKDQLAFESGANGELCPTSAMAKARHSLDQGGVFEPITADLWVEDEITTNELLGVPLKIINIPGHTAGSLVVVIDDTAFVGDMFRGGILQKSSAQMHLYQCDMLALTLGMEALLNEHAISAAHFFPSHLGYVTRASVESLRNKL